jgi:3-dehydroquinate dehydratase-2
MVTEKLRFIVVNGPNLNLLGERKPDLYGLITLSEINQQITKWGTENEVELKFFQSNHEGELIDWIHSERKWAHGIIINPAAYTHTSVAIRDCLEAVDLPAVEVHLTDPKSREEFRKVSYIESLCLTSFRGLGWMSYIKACEYLLEHLKEYKSINLENTDSTFSSNSNEENLLI